MELKSVTIEGNDNEPIIIYNLEEIASSLKRMIAGKLPDLKFAKHYNTPLTIVEVDRNYYECYSSMILNVKGTGSSSNGFDLADRGETKGTSWIQPKFCKSGGNYEKGSMKKWMCKNNPNTETKIHFFAETCPLCNESEFKHVHDSRWGIDAKIHFIGDVPYYILWWLKPDEYNYKCRKFDLFCFIIKSDNMAFTKILEVQNMRGKEKMKNFVPSSADFYISNPKNLATFHIEINEDYSDVDVTFNTQKKFPYSNKKILKIINKYLTVELNSPELSHIKTYNDLLQFIDIEQKKTSHGKSNGERKRRTAK